MNAKRLLRAVLLWPLLLLLFHTSAQAQSKTVTGTVTDGNNVPIQGASVIAKGTSTGTATDASGKFSLNVPSATTMLTISYVGYTSQDVSIGSSNSVSVSLQPASQADLNEVVVIGYGTARKKDVTGSVATVGAKDFNKGQINSPEQLLQGKVAGLQITNSSGQPGAVTVVKIRGNNSIRAGNTPLYVVDGIPLDGRSPRPAFNPAGLGNSPGGDPLTFINPNEIASVDVLKDASASAIYGSRGANGVILITTKKGASGPAKLEAAASVGISDVMRKIDVLDGNGFRNAIKQFNVSNADSGGNYDPLDQILRTAVAQNYSLALSGGGENGKYRASFFASSQEGIVRKTKLDKYVANFNGQYKFFDKKLSLDFSVTAANTSENLAPITNNAGAAGSLIGLALIWNPTMSYYNADGTFNQTDNSAPVNPMALSDAYNDKNSITTILASATAGYKITSWLEYRLLTGLNYGSGQQKGEIQGWIAKTGSVVDGQGFAAINSARLSSQLITHTLNFTSDAKKDLYINAVAGYEYWRTAYEGNGSNVYGFNYNLNQTNRLDIHYYDNMAAGNRANLNTYSFKDPKVEIQSYFARAVLSYKGKYSLTGTMRADGSSKFGKDNRYAYFPSLAAAWNINEEDFLKNSKLFRSLKLRAGYGETGNQEFAADAALDVYQYGSYGSLTSPHFGNPNLKWETVKAVDLGLDFDILNGHIYGSVDYFWKKTEDPLFLTRISQPTGGGGVIYTNLNNAYITNKGVEVAVGADIVTKKNFTWSVNLNTTFVKNNFRFPGFGTTPLVFTGELNGQGASGAYSEAIADNQPIDVFYLPTFNGFGKDSIASYSPADYVGNPNPNFFLGFTTDLRYKKFSLNIGTHGAFGNKIYNNTANYVLNISNIAKGRNIAANLVNAGESLANAPTPSTRYLENGNYFKVHSATLRYAVGDVGKTVKGLSVYVTGNNLFVITKYTGFDPEVNVDKSLNGIPSLGVDYIGFPTQRTILFGVNFSL